MRFTIALLAAATTALAQTVPHYASSLNMTIDPGSIDPQTAGQWCVGETNTCLSLCNQQVANISCVPDTLEYSCLCQSNDSMPGLQYYEQSMPTYICNALYSDCINEHVGDETGQTACKTNIMDLCGTLNAAKVSGGSSSSTSASSATAAATKTTASAKSTGTAGSNKASSSSAMSSSTSSGLAVPTMAPAAHGAAFAAIGALAYLI